MEPHVPHGGSKKKLIMAAHVAAEADRFQCDRCPWGRNEKGRHCDESNPAPYPQFVIQIAGRPFMESRICFLRKITPQSHHLLRLHMHYRKGVLPRAGGICDQPNLFVEAMELLEQTFNEIDIQRMKEQAKRQPAQ
jgi:hypothetical protein